MSDDFQQRGGSPWGTPPGGSGGGSGSGNGSGRGPRPPDIDKIIREFQEKIKKFTRWKFFRWKAGNFSFNYFRICMACKWPL